MGSEFGGTWEDPGGGFIKFAVKRALKQDQTLHMEEKLQFILYFSTEVVSKYLFHSHLMLIKTKFSFTVKTIDLGSNLKVSTGIKKKK